MFDSMTDIEFTSVEHPAANNIYAAKALDDYDVMVFYDSNQEISEEFLISVGEKKQWSCPQ